MWQLQRSNLATRTGAAVHSPWPLHIPSSLSSYFHSPFCDMEFNTLPRRLFQSVLFQLWAKRGPCVALNQKRWRPSSQKPFTDHSKPESDVNYWLDLQHWDWGLWFGNQRRNHSKRSKEIHKAQEQTLAESLRLQFMKLGTINEQWTCARKMRCNLIGYFISLKHIWANLLGKESRWNRPK